ncbi:hypothetical protein JCM24511_07468 [Saitozyma sp. JCM 24511]|nr:hypothetical protein JCM24511_07468 [Saitozyma sp. JCM 24511]
MSHHDSTLTLGELQLQHRPDDGDQDIRDDHQDQAASGSASESAEGNYPSPGEGTHGGRPSVTGEEVAATTQGTASEAAREAAEMEGASARSRARFGRWTIVLDIGLLGLSIGVHWWPQESRIIGLFVLGLLVINWHGLAERITPGHGAAMDEYGPSSRDVWIAAARRNVRTSSFFIISIQTLIEMGHLVLFL